MMQPGFDINTLFQEAQGRWLKPAEVLFILKNHDKYQLTEEPPHKPTSGSLFLFNKRVLRFFRRDGHNWRKKRDGRTVGEAHERLKVGNVEALNCYYAHGEQNPSFQRRSYWMLDPAFEHIVLVHYREINEGRPCPASIAQLSPGYSVSPGSHTTQNRASASAVSDLCEPYQNSASPGSVEVSSNLEIKENGVNSTREYTSSRDNEFSQFFRKLEEQLSLNEDSIKEIAPFSAAEGVANGSTILEYDKISTEDQLTTIVHGPEYSMDNQHYNGLVGMQLQTNNLPPHPVSGECRAYGQSYSHLYSDGSEESVSWDDMLESSKTSMGVTYQRNSLEQGKLQSSLKEPTEGQRKSGWINFSGTTDGNSSMLLPHEVDNFKMPVYPSPIEPHEINSDYYAIICDQGQFGSVEADSSLTVSQQQKFTIREIVPEWGYATEATKVIIVGSFLCDPSECAWTCMFGDTEVPLQIIQGGVIRCEAPPHLPGKVTLCITSSNRVSCSEIREFEYRAKSSGCTRCSSLLAEDAKSPDELLLLVRFVQMLLSDPSLKRGDSIETGIDLLERLKSDDDSWGSLIEALLVGSGTSSNTIDWLIQQLLKDKLQQWLSSKSQERDDQPGCLLSKKEQGIIHMVAGLGYEWALSSILGHGVTIDFRDINGWTALHWAARFGREKMVAALLASGASPGAVTDPSTQDPVGKTPASIASTSGHKGLAGYLSEKELTSHLSSLTLEESELSIGSAEVEAERTVDSISKGSFTANEDQISLKQTLAAVRNAAQAAARIQSAFRAHSFRKRQQRDTASVDEYGISASDIKGISAMSKLAFRNAHDYDSAALSIQKKYRGWKGRKDFLALRQKVVKIQAHVRGYQVRKSYKVICWAVGILDKVVLRWRRKGVGLRGFRNETESIEESEDEDILKVFRKQKVDGAIDGAVSRVLSMVDSPDARQQYHRMLERYRLAKAELGGTNEAPTSTSLLNVTDMEKDEVYHFE